MKTLKQKMANSQRKFLSSTDWSFKEKTTKNEYHKIHNYPATFPPQLATKLITELTKPGDLILDIFCGSGTTLLEAQIANRKAIGVDLNPLAHLISSVKTEKYDIIKLKTEAKKIKARIESLRKPILVKINEDYWFDERTFNSLKNVKFILDTIEGESYRNFFYVALSEIVRKVSLLKHSGFKMHKDKSKKAAFNIEELCSRFFFPQIEKNILKFEKLNEFKRPHETKVFLQDSRILNPQVRKNSAQLVLTSPPYGDSRTTVAYGEFSRLSLEVLDLGNKKYEPLDSKLLGGKRDKNSVEDFLELDLKEIHKINVAFKKLIKTEKDETKKNKVRRRRLDVLSFYNDLEKSFCNAKKYLKKGGHLAVIIANRNVLGVKLNSKKILNEILEKHSLVYLESQQREILKKRMPSIVNAKNMKGDRTPTMTNENILLYQLR